jgi:hypothetical protein
MLNSYFLRFQLTVLTMKEREMAIVVTCDQVNE